MLTKSGRIVALILVVSGLISCSNEPPSSPSSQDSATPFFTPTEQTPLASLEPLIQNPFGREHQALHGDWSFIVDQLKIGDASPLLRGGVGLDLTPGPDELLEYHFGDAYSLNVPGDWNSQRPELFWYRGVIWYKKTFELPLQENHRQFLYFGGAYFAKDVYLNGQLLARHRGGFTPFNLEISEYLQTGINSLVVKVDSQSSPQDVPTEYNDWMNMGGLTREVLVVDVPPVFVRDYSVQLHASRQKIEAWVQLDSDSGSSVNQPVRLEIPELSVDKLVETDATGRATFEIEQAPQLWSPENPHLYEVVLSTGGDRVRDQIGFRTIARQGQDILLNGEAIVLRGISTHEESRLHPGRAYGRDDAEDLMGLLKELNANFVRLAHYPHNEHVVRAADRAGILVWSEIPVYHSIAFTNPDTLTQAKQQYSEMISRDRNRASIVLWSIANETRVSDDRNQFLQSLAEHVRAQDATRLITAALLGFDGMEAIGEYIGRTLAAEKSVVASMLPEPDPVTIVIDDPLGEVVDVIGYNEYLGWYMSGFIAQGLRERGLEVTESEVRDTMLKEMEKFSIETTFDKPLIISEFGAGAKQGYFSQAGQSSTDVFTEDYQARVYRRQLRMLENSGALRGMSPWILKDFRAPYRLHTGYQDYWNRKGLISETGVKKKAFYVLADYYQSEQTGIQVQSEDSF